MTSNTSSVERRWEIGGIGREKYESGAQADLDINSYACAAVTFNTSSPDHELDLWRVPNRYFKEFVRKRRDVRKAQKNKPEVIFIEKGRGVLGSS